MRLATVLALASLSSLSTTHEEIVSSAAGASLVAVPVRVR
jgi:hypothetical protein